MATNLSTHLPIAMYETISGNTENTQNPPQAAGQTFLRGTPISLSAGFSQAWDGATINGGPGSIYGVSLEAGANLATAGSGYAPNFGQQGPPWSTVNIGAAPNQPSSVTIPYGAPFVTGGTLTMLAVGDTIFAAQYDTAEAASSITAGSVSSSGVLSATATNAHFAGEQIILSGFTSAGAPLNGLTAIVLPGGLSTSAYTAQLSTNPGAIGSTGTGTDNPTYAPTQGMVGAQFGLTIDANGSWYIDGAKHTSGGNTVVRIYGLYPGDVTQTNPFVEVPNGQLLFQFVSTVVDI